MEAWQTMLVVLALTLLGLWLWTDGFKSYNSSMTTLYEHRGMHKSRLYDSFTALVNPSPFSLKATERQPSFEEMLEQDRKFQMAIDERCGDRDFMPDFNPDNFNHPEYIKFNNCYAFAFLDRTKSVNRTGKPQPGYRAGLPPLSGDTFDAQHIVERVLLDYPGCIFVGPRYHLPECGYYTVSLVLAMNQEDGNRDYHWYRQDSNGGWSHKPGSTPVTNRDASGVIIVDPELADRDYFKEATGWGFDYDEFVGYFHVPSDSRWDQIMENNATMRHEWVQSSLNMDYAPPKTHSVVKHRLTR